MTLATDRPGGRAERFLAATRVEFDQGTLSVIAPDRSGLGRGGSLDVIVELPEGSSCLVHTASADVRCTGELSALDVHTASGDVSADLVNGVARVATASGDVYVAQAVEADLQSASGEVTIGQVTGPARVSTVSGDIRIDAASGSRTEAKSTSGDISVGGTARHRGLPRPVHPVRVGQQRTRARRRERRRRHDAELPHASAATCA